MRKGEYRRMICGTKECTADFFDPTNVDYEVEKILNY